MFFQHSPHCSLYMCDLRWARAPVVVVLVVDYDAAFRSLLDAGVGCSYSDGFARFLGVDVVAEEKGGEVVGGEALVAEVLAVLLGPLLGCDLGSLDNRWYHRRLGEADLFYVSYYDCAGGEEGFRFQGVEVY